MSLLVAAAILLGIATIVAAAMPSYFWFAVLLVPVGLSSMTFLNLCNTIVQLNTDARYRGRVLALYMAVIQGGTPIGAPIIGWIANSAGARWSILIGGFAALVAGVLGVVALARWGEGTLRDQLRAVWAARRDDELAEEAAGSSFHAAGDTGARAVKSCSAKEPRTATGSTARIATGSIPRVAPPRRPERAHGS
jgi:MFS family permease